MPLAEGVGIGMLVGGDEDVLLVREQVRRSLAARGLPRRAALGRSAESATVSTHDSTNAVISVPKAF